MNFLEVYLLVCALIFLEAVSQTNWTCSLEKQKTKHPLDWVPHLLEIALFAGLMWCLILHVIWQLFRVRCITFYILYLQGPNYYPHISTCLNTTVSTCIGKYFEFTHYRILGLSGQFLPTSTRDNLEAANSVCELLTSRESTAAYIISIQPLNVACKQCILEYVWISHLNVLHLPDINSTTLF